MGIERIGTAGAVPPVERSGTGGARFEKVTRERPPALERWSEPGPLRPAPARARAPRVEPGAWLARVAAAQARMDRILALAASGRTFSPAELLSLQAGIAEASQTVDLAGKVLDRVSGGVKTLLQTQV